MTSHIARSLPVHPVRPTEVPVSLVSSGLPLAATLAPCQTDLPIDWYQQELRPYAEEYLALPDRRPETVLAWMDRYMVPAMQHFGPQLMLLAHFYMGGEIVKLVERYGGRISDSYELARQAAMHPDRSIFVESAVHFMAETVALLKHDHQEVYITNPKSGCTMEALAKEDMVLPLFDDLQQRYGDDLMVLCYMNTSGRLKALAGRTGGAVCTSSNAGVIMRWARAQGRKIFFVPDQHLGRNTGLAVGLSEADMFLWPSGWAGAQQSVAQLSPADRDRLDRAQLILWGAHCGVHTVFQPRHVSYWKAQGYRVLVHPECTHAVVAAADGHGSTNYLWREVEQARPGDKLAIGTEGHFVRNARTAAALRGVEVQNLADLPAVRGGPASNGCGCATMSRNDPPHLVGVLDLLRQGRVPELNRVLPGDVVDERTGRRERLTEAARKQLANEARQSLERMIALTEAARAG